MNVTVRGILIVFAMLLIGVMFGAQLRMELRQLHSDNWEMTPIEEPCKLQK